MGASQGCVGGYEYTYVHVLMITSTEELLENEPSKLPLRNRRLMPPTFSADIMIVQINIEQYKITSL